MNFDPRGALLLATPHPLHPAKVTYHVDHNCGLLALGIPKSDGLAFHLQEDRVEIRTLRRGYGECLPCSAEEREPTTKRQRRDPL